MTAREQCASAEAGLAEAQRYLNQARPESIDRSVEALSQVAETLEKLAAGGAREADAAAIRRIQKRAAMLRLEIEHGSNLVRGWRQRQSGAGYTRGGLPEFADRDSSRNLEI
jgi:hypothetical protein